MCAQRSYQFNCTFTAWHPETGGANRSEPERASDPAVPPGTRGLALGTDLALRLAEVRSRTASLPGQARRLSFERTEGSAAPECSNRTGRNQPPYGPVRTAHLRQRPAPTPMPLDGKEKVYGSIP
jgi:hypothetical protein